MSVAISRPIWHSTGVIVGDADGCDGGDEDGDEIGKHKGSGVGVTVHDLLVSNLGDGGVCDVCMMAGGSSDGGMAMYWT